MNHEKKPMFMPERQQCGCPVEYSHEYDAYYCPACNRWLEGQCGDLDCEFCAGRPTRPVMVIIERHEARQRLARQRTGFRPANSRIPPGASCDAVAPDLHEGDNRL
jgi:hypothetical protein